jgi:protein-S-isoprenylcysteine O-methyltransferase Ste14
MEARSRRRPRRRRWTPAILLAAVALTVLVVASPAVARPAHMAHAHGATLNSAGTIAIVVIAVGAALALVLVAFLSGRQERSPRMETSRPKRVSRSASHGVVA